VDQGIPVLTNNQLNVLKQKRQNYDQIQRKRIRRRRHKSLPSITANEFKLCVYISLISYSISIEIKQSKRIFDNSFEVENWGSKNDTRARRVLLTYFYALDI